LTQTIMAGVFMANVSGHGRAEELNADRCAVALVGAENWIRTTRWLETQEGGRTSSCSTDFFQDHPCWAQRRAVAAEAGSCPK